MINAVHLVRESVRHVRLMREQEKVLSWHWSSIMMRYKLTYTADLIWDTLQAWPVRWHQRKDVYVSGWSKHGLTKATYCTANAFPPNASFLTDWIGPKTATAYIIQNTNSRCWVHSLICRFMSFPKPIPSSVLFPDLLQLYFPPWRICSCAFSTTGLFDKCFYASSDRGWLLGIKSVSEQGNRDPRFFFSLKTDRAHKVTSIHSNARYLPSRWAHVAVTYDGLYMKLYVNGAQTAVSREQSGDVFSPLTKKCKVSLILSAFQSLTFCTISWRITHHFFFQ